MRLPVPVSVTVWVRTYVHASNTAFAHLLGQHQLLPLATHVEAGTLGGLIAERLLSVCILPCPLRQHHARRTWTQSHIPFGLYALDYGISFLSRHAHTEKVAEHAMTRTPSSAQ